VKQLVNGSHKYHNIQTKYIIKQNKVALVRATFFKTGVTHKSGGFEKLAERELTAHYSDGRYRLTTSKFLNNVTDSPDDLDRAVFDSAINRPNCRLPSASDSPS
jgi:hypothetical protein